MNELAECIRQLRDLLARLNDIVEQATLAPDRISRIAHANIYIQMGLDTLEAGDGE